MIYTGSDSVRHQLATALGASTVAVSEKRPIYDVNASMVGGERGGLIRQRGCNGLWDAGRCTGLQADSELIDTVPAGAPHTVYIPSESRLLMPYSCLPRCEVKDELGDTIVWPWEGGSDGVSHRRRPRSEISIDAAVKKALAMATQKGDGGTGSTGVRAWIAFCVELEVTPHRPLDPSEPLWVKLEEEWLAMRFVCSLVEKRGIKPRTAASYFGEAQSWHLRTHGIKLASGIKLERLAQMLKGLRREHGDSSRRVRRGLRAADLRRAMDHFLDPKRPQHANMRAALATAFQGLLRGAEFTVLKDWNAELDMSRGDVAALSVERLVLMMRPAKNMNHLKGKTVPLVIGAGGAHLDAVAEVNNMLVVDPTVYGERGGSKAAAIPLFRDAMGKALKSDDVRKWIQMAMCWLGLDSRHFGLHSLRIGGATALFAAGADPLVIRTMGRWSSDCYRLYVRACFSQTMGWTRIAGSTQVEDIAGEFEEVDSY